MTNEVEDNREEAEVFNEVLEFYNRDPDVLKEVQEFEFLSTPLTERLWKSAGFDGETDEEPDCKCEDIVPVAQIISAIEGGPFQHPDLRKDFDADENRTYVLAHLTRRSRAVDLFYKLSDAVSGDFVRALHSGEIVRVASDGAGPQTIPELLPRKRCHGNRPENE